VGWCATAVAAAPTDSQNPTDHARRGFDEQQHGDGQRK
jgi:hypothetical protein